MELTKPTHIDGVEIKRFSTRMTGRKLKKQLGLVSNVYSKKTFKVQLKWRKIKKENRLKFLIKMNNTKGESLSFKEIKQRRDGFNANKFEHLPISEHARCYCCCENDAVLRHHIRPLAKGGRNRRNNIVPLCQKCHERIHPHLRKTKVTSQNSAPLTQNNGLPETKQEGSAANATAASS